MNSISWTRLDEFRTYLLQAERSIHTIEKYMRDIKAFLCHANGEELTKELIIRWKETLLQKYAVSSVNSMLAALNSFLCWAGMPIYKVKLIKVQRTIFRASEKELQKGEYERLIKAAQCRKNKRLSLVLQTICATGIRISELTYITVNAICTGRAVVDCKGKQRTVFLPKALCRSLTQ